MTDTDPNLYSKMFVLLATQRSGTNMLRSVLNTHPRVCAVPEVFHTTYFDFNRLPDFEYYEQYRRRAIEEDPSFILPERNQQCVHNYFTTIKKRAFAHKFCPILDIKYNSLHHANKAWNNPLEPPVMMEIFRARRIPVIHLRRRNRLAMAISYFRAQETRQFVEEDPSAISEIKFSVPPELLLQHMRSAAEHEKVISNWLKKLEISVLELDYNDLFIDGPDSNFDRAQFDKIADFIGVGAQEIMLKAKTKRLAQRSMRSELTNYDEIESALRDTPYSAFLD